MCCECQENFHEAGNYYYYIDQHLVVATDATHRSYVVVHYDQMGWNEAVYLTPPPANAPIVGYTNGQGQGFMETLGTDPANFLKNAVLVYRIDESFEGASFYGWAI